MSSKDDIIVISSVTMVNETRPSEPKEKAWQGYSLLCCPLVGGTGYYIISTTRFFFTLRVVVWLLQIICKLSLVVNKISNYPQFSDSLISDYNLLSLI